MSNYFRLVVAYPETVNEFKSFCDLTRGSAAPNLNNFLNYLTGVISGDRSATLTALSGPVRATATMTSTGSAVAAETFVLANVTFTARASGATGNEFNVSGTVATQAVNIKNAINNSTDLAGIVTATSSLGVVTITAVAPGLLGNAIQFSESLTNVTITQFTGGTDGTSVTMDFS